MFHSTKFLFAIASNLICWNRCGMVGKSQSMFFIKFLPTILLLRFYNSKSCRYRLRWNCRKESWWSWYHCFPNLGRVVLCKRRDKRRRHHCHLIHKQKNAKNKKGRGDGSLPSSSHFCHHIEAPLAFSLLLPSCWSSSCFHALATTTLKLLLLGHSWSSQPLKLLWILHSSSFEILKLSLG